MKESNEEASGKEKRVGEIDRVSANSKDRKRE